MTLPTVSPKGGTTSPESAVYATLPSPALEWLWRHLQDVRHPQVLDCGRANPTTINVLLRRGAKLFVADLVSSAQRGAPEFWDLSGKQAVFLVNDFLAQVPRISPHTVSAVFCWQLLDLLPRDAMRAVVEGLCRYLHPGGVLFCLLHEPQLVVGSDSTWWLQDQAVLGRGGAGKEPYPYPALSNRDVERLFPSGTVKTFLTRAGLREVLLIGR